MVGGSVLLNAGRLEVGISKRAVCERAVGGWGGACMATDLGRDVTCETRGLWTKTAELVVVRLCDRR
jgi:hypothetical protein